MWTPPLGHVAAMHATTDTCHQCNTCMATHLATWHLQLDICPLISMHYNYINIHYTLFYYIYIYRIYVCIYIQIYIYTIHTIHKHTHTSTLYLYICLAHTSHTLTLDRLGREERQPERNREGEKQNRLGRGERATGRKRDRETREKREQQRRERGLAG